MAKTLFSEDLANAITIAQLAQEPQPGFLDPLKAGLLAAKQSLGEDITGLGSVVQKLATARSGATKEELAQLDPNLLQSFGGGLEELTPEQQQLVEEHRIASTIGGIAGKVPGIAATSAIVPEANLLRLPKLAKLGIQGLRGAGQQTAYDVLTDKEVTPEKIVGAGLLTAGMSALPTKLFKLKPSQKKGIKDLVDDPNINPEKLQGKDALAEHFKVDDDLFTRAVKKEIKVTSPAMVEKNIKNAANEVETVVTKGVGKANEIYGKELKAAGIDTTRPLIDTKEILNTFKAKAKEVLGQDVTGTGQEVAAGLNNIIKIIKDTSKGGKISIDKIKQVSGLFDDLKQYAFDPQGNRTRLSNTIFDLKKQFRNLENKNPIMLKLNTKYAKARDALDDLDTLFRVRRNEGFIDPTMNRFEHRVTTLGRRGAEKQRDVLRQAQETLNKELGLGTDIAKKVDEALLNRQLLANKTKGLDTTGFGITTPGILKQAANLMQLTPQNQMRMLQLASGKAGMFDPSKFQKNVGATFVPKIQSLVKALKVPSIPAMPAINLPNIDVQVPVKAIMNYGYETIKNIISPIDKYIQTMPEMPEDKEQELKDNMSGYVAYSIKNLPKQVNGKTINGLT